MAIMALYFSTVAIKLSMIVESAQVVITGSIGQLQVDRVVAMTIGTHQLLMIRLGIAFFSSISLLMFLMQDMYQATVLQRTVSMTLKTTLVSTKIRVAANSTARQVRRRVASRRMRVERMPVS